MLGLTEVSAVVFVFVEFVLDGWREVVDGRGDSEGKLVVSFDFVEADDLPIPWMRALNFRLVAFIVAACFDVTGVVDVRKDV